MSPSRILCLALLAGLSSQVGLLHAAEEPLRVGVAEVDITPPMGFPMAGYYHERKATGTTRPAQGEGHRLPRAEGAGRPAWCAT